MKPAIFFLFIFILINSSLCHINDPSKPEILKKSVFPIKSETIIQKDRIYQDTPKVNFNVTFDHRSFIIDGKRMLLVAGAIHYPRSTPEMWPQLFQKTKDAGVNTIDVYVFWNLHEPQDGVFDFESRI